jgi:hypothetical protein
MSASNIQLSEDELSVLLKYSKNQRRKAYLEQKLLEAREAKSWAQNIKCAFTQKDIKPMNLDDATSVGSINDVLAWMYNDGTPITINCGYGSKFDMTRWLVGVSDEALMILIRSGLATPIDPEAKQVAKIVKEGKWKS